MTRRGGGFGVEPNAALFGGGGVPASSSAAGTRAGWDCLVCSDETGATSHWGCIGEWSGGEVIEVAQVNVSSDRVDGALLSSEMVRW